MVTLHIKHVVVSFMCSFVCNVWTDPIVQTSFIIGGAFVKILL